MATGRIGVTPTLGTRWSKAPAGGTTSLSGLDDNSVSLVYSVGYEQVYRNGVLLSRGNDYTATTGNSITLIDATIAGDIIEVFANELVPLTDAISKGQFTAKGALLSATAASTPGVLAVGTNGQYLQADSTTSTGLKWATLSAGAYTSLASGNLSNNTVTLSSISQDYTDLYLLVNNPVASLGDYLEFRINGSTGTYYCTNVNTGSAVNVDGLRDAFRPADYQIVGTTQNNIMVWLLLRNYAAANRKTIESGAAQTTRVTYGFGYSDINAAITSISIKLNDAGRTFSAGTYTLYGVK